MHFFDQSIRIISTLIRLRVNLINKFSKRLLKIFQRIGKRTRCILRSHAVPRENVAIAVHIFLLVSLDDLENPSSFAHRFSSGFHEFREPEPDPLRGERRPSPPPRDQPPRICFYNLVEDRGGEHFLVTVLRAVPLILDPSAPVTTSETRQPPRLLDHALHDVAKRLRRRPHIRARFVCKFARTLYTTPSNFFLSSFLFSPAGISNRESETNCRGISS